MTSDNAKPLRESTRVVVASSQASCNLEGDAVVLNLLTGMYHGLNEVGSRIWDLVQEPRSVGWIRDRIVEEFDVDSETCMSDLKNVLEAMWAAELIEFRNDADA